MPDYTAPVQNSAVQFTRFVGELIDQLDLEYGSFRWWHGHTDNQRLVLIADYLIQSCMGVPDALLDAAHCAADHREAVYADNSWLRSREQSLSRTNPKATHEDYLRAFHRGTHEDRRDRRIDTSATHALIHLVQVLDRLAAILVIVSGVSSDAIKAGWPAIERLAVEEDRKGKIYTAGTSEGVATQRALLATSQDWESFGPPDWLPWLLQTRHAVAHRAATTHWNLTTVGQGNRMTGLLRPFFRQPSRSEMHSLSYGPADEGLDTNSLEQLLVLEDSADVLDGLIASTNDFVLHVLAAVESTWRRRRDDADLIVQPESQWKLDPDAVLEFTGYGKAAKIQRGGFLTVGPQLSKRIQAAKIMDDDRHDFWA
ncbi:hypothetical protein V6K52_03475 [Knoellia sp. S7-12]|uniref:hypothetical protein n=1 Tax=Knoellia sp. S7-12 TaxID=3126698 RepID=UPI00336640EF